MYTYTPAVNFHCIWAHALIGCVHVHSLCRKQGGWGAPLVKCCYPCNHQLLKAYVTRPFAIWWSIQITHAHLGYDSYSYTWLSLSVAIAITSGKFSVCAEKSGICASSFLFIWWWPLPPSHNYCHKTLSACNILLVSCNHSLHHSKLFVHAQNLS